MGKSIARLGDRTDHGGRIISGSARTTVNGMPVARVGDRHSCPEHGLSTITEGSERTIVEGKPVARVDDRIGCGAVIISGSPDVEA